MANRRAKVNEAIVWSISRELHSQKSTRFSKQCDFQGFCLKFHSKIKVIEQSKQRHWNADRCKGGRHGVSSVMQNGARILSLSHQLLASVVSMYHSQFSTKESYVKTKYQDWFLANRACICLEAILITQTETVFCVQLTVFSLVSSSFEPNQKIVRWWSHADRQEVLWQPLQN